MFKSFKIVRWVVKILFEALPRLIIILILLQVFTAIIPFLENLYFSKIVDDILMFVNSGSNKWVDGLIILLLVKGTRILARNLLTYVERSFNFRLEAFLKKLFTFKIASFDIQHFEDKEMANLIAKVKDEYQWRFRDIVSLLSSTLVQFISFLTVLYFLLPHYWYLMLLIVIGEIPGFFVDKNFNNVSWKFFNENTQKNRQSWDLANYLTSKNYLSELKVNQSVGFLKGKFLEIVDFFVDGRLKLRNEKLPRDLITSMFSILTMGVGLVVIINDVRSGVLTIGMLTFYYSILRQTGDFFTTTLTNYLSISEHVMYLENFKQILETKTNLKDGTRETILASPPLIEFKNVSFKYPESNKYVFKNFNLVINPKDEIAVVGVNGAGKSTLIKLLCRFYDPTEGEILISGINLKDISLNKWYEKLSVLFQEFTRYPSLSLRDNVKVSADSVKHSDDENIISALRKADALEFVQKYKSGLDTNMSQRYGGEEPSWGQWQKIAISRIFYRNSPVMILDEPTASIDAVSESKIFSNLYRRVKNKTIIIVSHRFSTVRNARRIIVVDRGKIVEDGSHEQLMKKNGLYSKSFKLQAKGYQESA